MIQCQLLTGGTDREKLKKIGEFLEKHTNSAPSLFEPNPDLFSLFPEKSIGILEIKKLISFLSRKPFSKDVKVVLIFEADKLTIPAQNALLKTLEEPPKDSFIFLLTDRSFAFLPTILSRVESVKITSKQKPGSNLKQEEKVKEILKQVLNQTPGERIALSLEIAKNKNDVEKLCTNFLFFLRALLRKRLELESGDSMKPPPARLPAGKAGRLGVSSFVAVLSRNPPQAERDGDSSPSTEAGGFRLAAVEIKTLSVIQINDMIKAVENARKMLDANVNFHLVVENMLLNFPNLTNSYK